MYSPLQTALIGLLVAALADVPSLAGLAKPIGVITQADDARLGSTEAAMGTTVYSGDSLETGASGAMRLRVGRSQLYLLESSTAVVGDLSGGIRANLSRGTAGFVTSGAQALEIVTPLAVVRPKPSQTSHGQVTLVSPGEFLVSCYLGTLEVDVEGEIHAVGQGQAYRVIMEPEPQDSQDGKLPGPRAGTVPIRRNKMRVIFIAVGIGTSVWVGAWIYHELTESPSKMDDR